MTRQSFDVVDVGFFSSHSPSYLINYLKKEKIHFNGDKAIEWIKGLIDRGVITSCWVGVVVYDGKNSSILVVRESDKPALSLPGGGYEIEDKNLKMTGARELFQETGYFVNFNNLFFVDAFFKSDEKNPGVHCKLFLGCFKEDIVAVRNLSFPNGSIVEIIDLPIIIKDDEIVFVGGKMLNIHRVALESFVEVADVC